MGFPACCARLHWRIRLNLVKLCMSSTVPSACKFASRNKATTSCGWIENRSCAKQEQSEGAFKIFFGGHYDLESRCLHLLRAVNGGHAQSQPRGSTSCEAFYIHKAEAVATDSAAGMCKNFHYSQPEPPSVEQFAQLALLCHSECSSTVQNRSDYIIEPLLLRVWQHELRFAHRQLWRQDHNLQPISDLNP